MFGASTIESSSSGGAGPKLNSAPVTIDRRTLDNCGGIWKYLTDEENVRPAIHGVLAVNIKSANLMDSKKKDIQNTFASLSTKNFSKRTKTMPIVDYSVSWHQTKHFPVAVVRNKRHPYSLFQIQVFSVDTDDPDHSNCIGTVSFHIHDIIYASPISGTYDLWEDHAVVGDIDIELTFSYGSFGYGNSRQLQEKDCDPIEMVQYALFPKLIAPRESCEPNSSIFIVQATPHPPFIPFSERVFLAYGKEIRNNLRTIEETYYQPNLLVSEMGKLGNIRDEYYSTDDRLTRLLFLYEYLQRSTNITESLTSEPVANSSQLPNRNYVRFVQSSMEANKPKSRKQGLPEGVVKTGELEDVEFL